MNAKRPEPDPDAGKPLMTLLLEEQERQMRENIKARRPPTGLAVQAMSDVRSLPIAWLWERWIPSGMLTLLGGYGGDGKSTVMASLIGAWTSGGSLPTDSPPAEGRTFPTDSPPAEGRTLPDGTTTKPVNVLMLSAEDDASLALRPRLELHGANPKRVFVVTGTIRGDGRTRWFDLKRDVEVMREVIVKRKIGLVVIDPLSSYLPRADRNSEGDIRDTLQPLMGLMEQTGVGIVGVMHIGKAGAGRRMSQRLLGSTAFTALARSVLMLADVPDERQPEDTATGGKLKVLQVVKSNYSIPPAPQLFRRPLDAPIAWLGDAAVDIEECFEPPARDRGRSPTERNDAIDFLKEILATGAVPTKEIFSQATAQGFSERTLRRAKKALGALAFHNSSGNWAWYLPDDPDAPESVTRDPRKLQPDPRDADSV